MELRVKLIQGLFISIKKSYVVSKAKSIFRTLLNFFGGLAGWGASGVKKSIPVVIGANVGLTSVEVAIDSLAIGVASLNSSSISETEPKSGELRLKRTRESITQSTESFEGLPQIRIELQRFFEM